MCASFSAIIYILALIIIFSYIVKLTPAEWVECGDNNTAEEHQFYIGSNQIEVVDSYQYLGIILKPSGSMQFAVSELCDKASRAWFAISNVLYKYKRLPIHRAFQLFDSLIRPIALFSCEFWLPIILTKKNFVTKDALLKAWESFNNLSMLYHP